MLDQLSDVEHALASVIAGVGRYREDWDRMPPETQTEVHEFCAKAHKFHSHMANHYENLPRLQKLPNKPIVFGGKSFTCQ